MGSFYIPCVAMLGLYWKMFSTIRQRARQSMLRRPQTRNEPNAGGAAAVTAREDIRISVRVFVRVRALEIFVDLHVH